MDAHLKTAVILEREVEPAPNHVILAKVRIRFGDSGLHLATRCLVRMATFRWGFKNLKKTHINEGLFLFKPKFYFFVVSLKFGDLFFGEF